MKDGLFFVQKSFGLVSNTLYARQSGSSFLYLTQKHLFPRPSGSSFRYLLIKRYNSCLFPHITEPRSVCNPIWVFLGALAE